MSQHRRISGRDKVIGKQIYCEIKCGPFRKARGERLGPKIWGVEFLWAGQLHKLMGGRIIPTHRKGQELGHHPHFGLLWSASKLFWHLWTCHSACYNEHLVKLKVHRKSNHPPSWTSLCPTSYCHILKDYVVLLKVVSRPLPSCFKTILMTSFCVFLVRAAMLKKQTNYALLFRACVFQVIVWENSSSAVIVVAWNHGLAEHMWLEITNFRHCSELHLQQMSG